MGLAASDIEPPCPDCLTHQGLCHRHEKGVLPLLAENVGWLRLIGEAQVEQKTRQTPKVLPISGPHESWLARRKHARSVARSKRRGYFGLAKAIARAT